MSSVCTTKHSHTFQRPAGIHTVFLAWTSANQQHESESGSTWWCVYTQLAQYVHNARYALAFECVHSTTTSTIRCNHTPGVVPRRNRNWGDSGVLCMRSTNLYTANVRKHAFVMAGVGIAAGGWLWWWDGACPAVRLCAELYVRYVHHTGWRFVSRDGHHVCVCV